jgi:hypothetical protein
MFVLPSNKQHIQKISYFCTHCKKHSPLFTGLRINNPKIPLHTYFLAIFKWLENKYEKDILRNLNISKGSFQSIKKLILEYVVLKMDSLNKTKIGGDKKVQVDETAICHGFLLDCPSKTKDEFPGVTWLIGAIEEHTRKNKLKF